MIYCPICYKKISKNAKACPSCGHPIDESVTNKTLQKKVTRKIRGLQALGGIIFVVIMAIAIAIAW